MKTKVIPYDTISEHDTKILDLRKPALNSKMAVRSSLKPNLDEAKAENNFIAILCKNRGLEKFTDQSFTFDKALQGFETSWIRKTWARKEIESNQ